MESYRMSIVGVAFHPITAAIRTSVYLGVQIAAIDASQKLASLGSLEAVDLRLKQSAAFDFGKFIVATRFADFGHSIPVVHSGRYHSAAPLVMCTTSNENLRTTLRYDPKLSGMQLFIRTEVGSGRDLMVYQNLSAGLCLAVKAPMFVPANHLLHNTRNLELQQDRRERTCVPYVDMADSQSPAPEISEDQAWSDGSTRTNRKNCSLVPSERLP